MQAADHAPCFRVANYCFVCCWLLLIALFTVGCSTANVQHEISHEIELEQEPAKIPQIQTASLIFEIYYTEGGDVTFGSLADVEIEETFFLAEEPEVAKEHENMISEAGSDSIQQECYYEAELAGQIWLSVPEPELIEDPLVQGFCGEDVHPWCDPEFEETYLSYLELEKQARFEAAIFPNFVSPVDNALVLRGMQPPSKKRRGHYGSI